MAPEPLASFLRLLALAALAALLAVPLACAGDDDETTTSAATVATGTSSGGETTADGGTGTSGETGVTETSETTEVDTTPAPLPEDPNAAAAARTYRAYLVKQAARFAAQTAELAKWLRQGQPARAQALYGKVRATYERIQPAIVDLDLDSRLAAHEDEAQGDWIGLHAIEKTLFDTGTTVGTEVPGRLLAADARGLRARVVTIPLDPAQILQYAEELLGRVNDRTITPEEEPYSLRQLYAISGNVQGARAAYDAIRPLVRAANGPVGQTDLALGQAIETVESFRAPVEFRTYDQVNESDVQAILEAVANARNRLARLEPIVGG